MSAYILPREGEEESLVYTASAGALIATKLCGSILDTVIMVSRIEPQTSYDHIVQKHMCTDTIRPWFNNQGLMVSVHVLKCFTEVRASYIPW